MGRPRTVDRYAERRDQMFDTLTRLFAEQRTRVLTCGVTDSHRYSAEDLEVKRRRMILGPALRYFKQSFYNSHTDSLYRTYTFQEDVEIRRIA
jgi:hypothetical protein